MFVSYWYISWINRWNYIHGQSVFFLSLLLEMLNVRLCSDKSDFKNHWVDSIKVQTWQHYLHTTLGEISTHSANLFEILHHSIRSESSIAPVCFVSCGQTNPIKNSSRDSHLHHPTYMTYICHYFLVTVWQWIGLVPCAGHTTLSTTTGSILFVIYQRLCNIQQWGPRKEYSFCLY